MTKEFEDVKRKHYPLSDSVYAAMTRQRFICVKRCRYMLIELLLVFMISLGYPYLTSYLKS